MKSLFVVFCALLALFSLYNTVDATFIPVHCRHDSLPGLFAARHPFYVSDYSGTQYRVNQTNFAINHTAAEIPTLEARAGLLTPTGIFDFYQDNYWAGDAECHWISTLFFAVPGIAFGAPNTTWIFLVDYSIRPLGPLEGITIADDVPRSIFTKETEDFDFIGYFGQGEQEISNEVDQFGVCNHFVNEAGHFTKTTNPHNPGGVGYPHRFYISGDITTVAKFGGPMISGFQILFGSRVTEWDRPEIAPLLASWRDGTFECLEINMGFGTQCYNIAILSDLPEEKRGINGHARARAMIEGRTLSVDWSKMPFQYPLKSYDPIAATKVANGQM